MTLGNFDLETANEFKLLSLEKQDKSLIDMFSELTGFDYVMRRPFKSKDDTFDNLYFFSNEESYTKSDLERLLPEKEDLELIRDFTSIFDVLYKPNLNYDEDGNRLYFFNDDLGGYTPKGLECSVLEKIDLDY